MTEAELEDGAVRHRASEGGMKSLLAGHRRKPSMRRRDRGDRQPRRTKRSKAREVVDGACCSKPPEGIRLERHNAPEGFEQAEWDIMYPRFVERGLIRDGYFYL